MNKVILFTIYCAIASQQLVMSMSRELEFAARYGQDIVWAARKHVGLLQKYIETGCFDVNNIKDKYGHTDTLLNWAVDYGNLETVEFLLEHGADVNKAGANGTTALHVAVRALSKSWPSTTIRIQILTTLLQAGAHVNAEDDYGTMPLDEASCIGIEKEALTMLIKYGADVVTNKKYTPLHGLCRKAWRGDNEVLKIILDGISELSLRKAKAAIFTMLAAGKISVPASWWHNMMRLIYHQLCYDYVNASNDDGDTPLHVAAQYDKCGDVCKLLQAGADMTIANNDHKKPLQIALLKGRLKGRYFTIGQFKDYIANQARSKMSTLLGAWHAKKGSKSLIAHMPIDEHIKKNIYHQLINLIKEDAGDEII